MQHEWLAAYLYHNGSWETLLSESLAPFVKQVMADGLAEHYFYIRYYYYIVTALFSSSIQPYLASRHL